MRIKVKEAKSNQENMEELINEFMPLISKTARRYSNNVQGDLYFECLSEGVIGFTNCVQKYPLDSKIHFVQYALKAVNSHVKYFIDKSRKVMERLISINTSIGSNEDLTIEDTLSDNINLEESFLKEELMKSIKEYVKGLKEIEQTIFYRHIINGETLKEIERSTSYSYRGIKYAKERLIRKIKKDVLEK